MQFSEVVETSRLVAAASARSAKRDLLAELLRRCTPEDAAVVVPFLVGAPRQGRIGIGWRTLAEISGPRARTSTLTVAQVDEVLTQLATLSGPGSGAARTEVLQRLSSALSTDEWVFLERLLGGELRQGASAGVMVDAVARAAEVPVALARRALMLGGRLDQLAELALAQGSAGLAGVGLVPGRPLQPMLASTATSAGEAVATLGAASVEWKLDGIRIQVHRDGERVRIWTRNLNEITDRLPGVVDAVRSLPVHSIVLDGEALAFDAAGRPKLFQDTVRADAGAEHGAAGSLRPFFFDLLHLDGVDLIDEPLEDRRAELHRVAGPWAIPSELTDDGVVAERVLADALDAGHEGVVIKGAASIYEAGRRGTAWRKVKPVHTLDLVVLGAEWGHGRRTGWLSNLHLGAVSDDGAEVVMVGKTFKGLTDELLSWQTRRLCALAGQAVPDRASAPVGEVMVAPALVVEIAVDGVQRSRRYPGGVALRFARVVRYREDKDPADADRISTVRALLAGSEPGG